MKDHEKSAPVVERQPVAAWQRKSKNEDDRWFYLPDSDVEEAIRLVYEVRKLYTAPPELAELQATIAKLTAEIERLKGGQGEPIYQVQYRGDGGGGWSDAEKASYDAKVPHPSHWMTRIVYTSQPAPVSVVLPERMPMPRQSDYCGRPVHFASAFDTAMAHNDCLDKVKELNQ